MPLVCIAKTCIVTCLPSACSTHGMPFMYAIMRSLYARYSTVVISHSCLDLAICGTGRMARRGGIIAVDVCEHAGWHVLGAERSSSVSISALDHRRSSHRRGAFRCWPTGSRWSASDSRASAGEGAPIRLFCVSRLISICSRLAPR